MQPPTSARAGQAGSACLLAVIEGEQRAALHYRSLAMRWELTKSVAIPGYARAINFTCGSKELKAAAILPIEQKSFILQWYRGGHKYRPHTRQ